MKPIKIELVSTEPTVTDDCCKLPSRTIDIDNLPPVLTVEEVAKLARVSAKTIRRAVERKALRPINGTGRAHRLFRNEVLRWLSGSEPVRLSGDK
jgi:excisionase family DNA binding protein